MADQRTFYLFAYGTLMDPAVFRAVTGKELVLDPSQADGHDMFLAVEAILDGYKKVSPDSAYLYAVPDPQGRISGLMIGPTPRGLLKSIRKYEGRNYSMKRLKVLTKNGPAEAVVFVGNRKQLEHHFGYAFHDPLKQEVLLDRKIEQALLETEKEQLNTTEQFARRAVGELHGSLIRDLVRKHFDGGGISDYIIRTSLKDTPIRDFSRIAGDDEAESLAPNYLAMVVRQVLFNQFEERIRRDFRYELDHMGLGKRFYDRTISSLVALRMLNNRSELLDLVVADCLTDLRFPADSLVDFVRWSVIASDAVYNHRDAQRELSFVQHHMGRGYVSLGAELEFSDIGHKVIQDPNGQTMRDRRYDGFVYFSDFGLDLLTWKLGGHVDDHHTKVSTGQPRRGFFEVALGSLSIQANISKPITDDPWLLNQMVHETRRFFHISPHSLHVSLQLRTQHKPVRDRLLPMGALKCLFALGGDLQVRPDGRCHVSRLTSNEIIDRGEEPHMLFSDISKRFSSEQEEPYLTVEDDRRGLYVQQFRFLKLRSELNYEPIALALKGLQIALRPGTFMTAQQYAENRRHREAFHEILDWGADPQPISTSDRETFLGGVYSGLMTEKRGKPAHGEAYIAWAISELNLALDAFNNTITLARRRSHHRPAGTSG
jgi:hypothetical protein